MVGVEARKVLADAKAMLKRIVEGKWLRANGVFGLFHANSVNHGEDIEIYADEKRDRVLMTWHNLRQQNRKPTGNPNLCLGDFVAPRDSGVADYVGAFAVTAGLGIDKRVKALRREARRLQRDHAEGARRPAGRGVRGTRCTSACAASCGATRRTRRSTTTR